MTGNKMFIGFSTNDVVPGNTKTTMYDLDLVKRDLLNQFMTRKGERVMLPNYGSIIWDQLFEPFTDAIKNLIVQDVVRIINSEPRVILKSVNVYETQHGVAVDNSLYYAPWNVVDSLNLTFDAENHI